MSVRVRVCVRVFASVRVVSYGTFSQSGEDESNLYFAGRPGRGGGEMVFRPPPLPPLSALLDLHHAPHPKNVRFQFQPIVNMGAKPVMTSPSRNDHGHHPQTTARLPFLGFYRLSRLCTGCDLLGIYTLQLSSTEGSCFTYLSCFSPLSIATTTHPPHHLIPHHHFFS